MEIFFDLHTPKIAAELQSREPWLVPVRPEEATRMQCFDLASYVSYRCGVDLDPQVLEAEAVRERWQSLATDEPLSNPFAYGRPYWMVNDAGETVGSIAFWIWGTDRRVVCSLHSIYVVPQHRRRGWARRGIEAITKLLLDAEIEVIISCEWGNDAALRLYLQQGFLVDHWKHDIRLHRTKDMRPINMVVEGDRASFLVDDRIVGVARNNGDRLDWQLADGVEEDWKLKRALEATASLHLALIGWPLIREDERWREQLRTSSDQDDFEGLAHWIRHSERYWRSQGWKIPAPNPSYARIPTILGCQTLEDRFQVQLSDGRTLPLPFVLLFPEVTDDDPVVNVEVTEDELHYTVRSGITRRESVDSILGYNDTPEHLQEMVQFWRDNHAMLREG